MGMNAVCICCGAEVPPGSVYCPNCLVTLLKPDDYEEVIENGNYRSGGG